MLRAIRPAREMTRRLMPALSVCFCVLGHCKLEAWGAGDQDLADRQDSAPVSRAGPMEPGQQWPFRGGWRRLWCAPVLGVLLLHSPPTGAFLSPPTSRHTANTYSRTATPPVCEQWSPVWPQGTARTGLQVSADKGLQWSALIIYMLSLTRVEGLGASMLGRHGTASRGSKECVSGRSGELGGVQW